MVAGPRAAQHAGPVRPSLPALVVLAAVLTGCTGDARGRPAAAQGCGALDAQREEQLGGTDVPEVPEQQANVVVKLSSSSAQPQRITLRAAGRVLLAVRVPAAPPDCYLGGKVFTHRFRLPATPTRIEATAGEDRSATVLTPGAQRQWLTLLPQDGFPLDLKAWPDEPLFG